MAKASLGGREPHKLLPLRLQQIYMRLLDGLYCDSGKSYPALQRLALLLGEIEYEVGPAKLKAIVRRVDRVVKGDARIV